MAVKPPAFQFYAKDWRSSHTVLSMSMHHRGIFITLLAAAWDSDEPGTLPLPIEIAARSAQCDPRSVRDFLSKYPRCFVDVGGKLVNEKLRQNWLRYMEISDKRRKSAEVRHHANACANASQVLCPAPAPAPAPAPKRKDHKNFVPPEAHQVKSYMEEIGFSDAEETSMQFVDFYSARGWIPGGSRQKMKDWKGAVRYWMRRRNENGNGNGHRFETPSERSYRLLREDVEKMRQRGEVA